MRLIILVFSLGVMSVSVARADAEASAVRFDLVIKAGRVMDPETGFDAIRNVGIIDDRIAMITAEPLVGSREIDAQGLVVAPGFIDTHFHSQDEFATKMALRDGVTTGMDLEAGAYNVEQWYDEKKNRWQINYGVTASHLLHRMKVMDSEIAISEAVDATNAKAYLNRAANDGTASWSVTRANEKQMNAIIKNMDEELRAGALGVGLGLAYAARGATSYEVFEVQKAASRYGRLASVHTRYHLDSIAPTEAPIAFDEVFANAVLLGAPLLLAHNNDYGWEENEEKLQLARAQGLNMWSEHYPYAAGSTFVSADFLRPELWKDKYGFDYESTLYHPEADRFLTQSGYEKMVEEEPGTFVVVFMPPRKKWMKHWLYMPHMTVASDGMQGVGRDGKLLPWEAEYSAYAGHPRTAGARAKTLRLARENQVPLMHTLSQLSYWSAKHLGDAGVQAMKERGRVQVGAIADLTLFDPETVTDHATYKAAQNGLPSTGIEWVLVNGQVVVERSKVLRSVQSGQPIRYEVEKKGRYQKFSASSWLKRHGVDAEQVSSESSVSHLH